MDKEEIAQYEQFLFFATIIYHLRTGLKKNVTYVRHRHTTISGKRVKAAETKGISMR